jgi:phosphoglycolate phosphatase
MAGRGLAAFTRAEVAAMVGDGARLLVERGFSARGQTPDSTALADFLDDYTANAARETRAYDGVEATLGLLAEQGWRMAVCTNKPIVPARMLLAELGLARFFAAIGGGDSYAVRKPDPGHLLATLAEAGGDPRLALMVGDHHNDVAAAAGAGMRAIFAAWGYGPIAAGADAAGVASSINDVPAIAARLIGQA